MNSEHSYAVSVEWTGNRGAGTSSYKSYGRDTVITASGKHEIQASADRTFHGDADRWNPEETLLAALSQCHLLSFLHVATRAGIVVESYEDSAVGTLHTNSDGSGAFTDVTLHPVVTISAGDPALVPELHAEANRLCFIAASVNFPVHHEAQVQVIARG